MASRLLVVAFPPPQRDTPSSSADWTVIADVFPAHLVQQLCVHATATPQTYTVLPQLKHAHSTQQHRNSGL